jgi:uncharacterized membrane protein
MIEWSSPHAPWIVAAAGMALGGVLVVARRLAISPRLRRTLLFALRAAVFGLLLCVLLNPVRRSDVLLPADPPQLVCLVDASRSMALDLPVSRLDQARQVVQTLDESLSGADRPTLAIFRFGTRLESAGGLTQLAPTDDDSLLADALEQMPTRFGRIPPAAVVVFSDGAVPAGPRLAEAAAAYRRLGLPVHVYPLGHEGLRGDVAVQDLVIPARAEVGAKVPLRAVLRAQGFADERAEVRVRAADRPADAPLATLPVTLIDGELPVELVVESPADVGELLFEVLPLEGEITAANNRVPFQLAQRNRKLKVLYMEGTASNEYRWVHEALQEDKDIECLSMVADQQYVERPRLQRIGDPLRGFPATREELLQYDCVICSDISQGAFTREQLDWTVELVADRGGGFAMVGGITSFGAGGWDQTVWDQLIPVDMQGGVQGRGWLYHQFNVRVPADVETHPIWRIVEDAAQNRRVLDAMPPFGGTNYIQRLKPAATSLAVSASEIPGAGIMTIFACESYGRGRTFAFAPDTTVDWGRYFESQWGEAGDNRYFRRFWRNVVRWLTENSIAGDRRLRIETDRIIYRPGQPLAVLAEAFDEQMLPTVAYELTARLIDPRAGGGKAGAADGDAAGVTLTPATAENKYHAQLPPTAWHGRDAPTSAELQGVAIRNLEVVATHEGREIARAVAKVQLLADSPELRQPVPRPEELARLAEASGGRVLRSGGDLMSVATSLPRREGDVIVTRSPLWDSAWLWAAIIALLAVDWSLRRRAGFG